MRYAANPYVLGAVALGLLWWLNRTQTSTVTVSPPTDSVPAIGGGDAFPDMVVTDSTGTSTSPADVQVIYEGPRLMVTQSTSVGGSVQPPGAIDPIDPVSAFLQSQSRVVHTHPFLRA